MKNRFMAILVFCMAVIMVLSACTNSPGVPTADAVITINGGSPEKAARSAVQPRTMLPENLPEISAYDISLSEVKSEAEGTVYSAGTPTRFTTSELETAITFKNLKLGTYAVTVNAIGKTGAEYVLTGAGDDYLRVTADGNNTVNVTMGMITDNEFTGSVSMTFDWADIANTNETIMNAMKNGGLFFILYYYDDSSKTWMEADRSEKTGTKTNLEFIVNDLPCSTGLRLKYALATADGVILNPALTTTVAQIYKDMISIQKGNNGNYIYYISDSEISGAVNVYNVNHKYGPDEGSSVTLTWNNQMVDGKSLFDYVNIKYSSAKVSEKIEKCTDVSGATSSFDIKGMEAGDEYTVSFQAHHTSGLLSSWYVYEEKVSAEVIVKAPTDVTAEKVPNAINVSWTGVDGATAYTVYRSDNNGSYTAIAEKITNTSYSDTSISTGYDYSYKIQAFIGELAGDQSEASNTVKANDSVINISADKPEDIQASFNQEGDLVLIRGSKEPLTVSVGNIEGVSLYTWYINGAEAKSAGPDGGTFIDITETTNGVYQDPKTITNKLELVVTDASGYKYSSGTITLYVVNSLPTGVQINYNGPTRISSETSEGVQRTISLADLKTEVIGGDVKDIVYTVEGNTALAEIKDGKIIFNNPDNYTNADDYKVTIKASSINDKSATIEFELYKPTLKDATSLVDALNITFNSIFSEAKVEDWRGAETNEVNKENSIVYDKNGVYIVRPYTVGPDGGYVTISNCEISLDDIEDVILNTKENGQIKIAPSGENNSLWWAKNDKLAIWGDDNTSYLDIILPYNQGTVTIRYDHINVENNTRSGKYYVTFNNLMGFNESFTKDRTVEVLDSDVPTALKPNEYV